MLDLIIVGGGAAGLWAAGTAAERGKKVLVLEKNRKAGVKILMSGGTRCNITHACDRQGILKAFGKQGRFLKHSLHTLSPDEVVQTFNQLGVATKVEDTGKIFPVSNRAIDVRDALVRRLTTAGAELRTGVSVSGFSKQAEGWRVQVDAESIESQKLLLCCGGLSYPGCGTTGDGYGWTRELGHTIAHTHPALTPLLSPATWVHQLKGITLPDVAIRIQRPGKKLKDPRASFRGGFLWTHFGCSGPAPMNVSRFVTEVQSTNSESTRAEQVSEGDDDTAQSAGKHADLLGKRDSFLLNMDLVPDVDEAELAEHFSASGDTRRRVTNILKDLVPRNMAACIAAHANVSDEVSVSELPRASRLQIIDNLKRMQVPINGSRGYAKAEVTAGGVATAEVDPKTMQSRLIDGLYFAGEILDFDGPIGGYNFQAAFSTGHVAALQI